MSAEDAIKNTERQIRDARIRYRAENDRLQRQLDISKDQLQRQKEQERQRREREESQKHENKNVRRICDERILRIDELLAELRKIVYDMEW